MARQKYSAYWCSVAAVIFLINVLAISIVGGHGADVPIQMAPSLPIPEHRHPPKKSRQRRFLLPSASGWVARLTFGLFIPVPDVNSVLALTLPLTYTIDTGTYVLTFFSRLQLGSSREGKDFQGSIALCFLSLDSHDFLGFPDFPAEATINDWDAAVYPTTSPRGSS